MNFEVKKQILDKIMEYDRIMLFRHVRNDGDCVGATKGLKRILQISFPEKEIYLIDEDTAKYLEFMGPEDEPVADELYADALGIVIDTASEARISNKKYALCKELIKIDHHIPLESFGNIIWVEEERSSSTHWRSPYCSRGMWWSILISSLQSLYFLLEIRASEAVSRTMPRALS